MTFKDRKGYQLKFMVGCKVRDGYRDYMYDDFRKEIVGFFEIEGDRESGILETLAHEEYRIISKKVGRFQLIEDHSGNE